MIVPTVYFCPTVYTKGLEGRLAVVIQ